MAEDALLAHLRKELDPVTERRLLFTAKYGQIPRLNLALLQYFLQLKGQGGVYVSIDRPHKYAELLLRRTRIPLEKLLFVDLVTRGSSSRSADTKAMLSVGGFFWLKLLSGAHPEVFAPGSEAMVDFTLDGKEFVLMDNVAILPAYNSEQSIREFFSEFGNVLASNKEIRALLVTHSEIHPALQEILEGFSEVVIEIGGDW